MKGVCLLSGGLDSTVNLAYARREMEIVLCLTADYGQLAARREIEAAQRLARHYNIPHRVVRLPFLARLDTSALTGRRDLPSLEMDELDDHARATETARAVWVPNRNGLLINVAACYAETLGAGRIVVGFNREEAATFPDNSAAFLDAVNRALACSTHNRVQVVSYTLRLTKEDIVRLGNRLGVPWAFVWSCYRGEKEPCGHCESCRRLQRAFLQAKGEDDAHLLS